MSVKRTLTTAGSLVGLLLLVGCTDPIGPTQSDDAEFRKLTEVERQQADSLCAPGKLLRGNEAEDCVF